MAETAGAAGRLGRKRAEQVNMVTGNLHIFDADVISRANLYKQSALARTDQTLHDGLSPVPPTASIRGGRSCAFGFSQLPGAVITASGRCSMSMPSASPIKSAMSREATFIGMAAVVSTCVGGRVGVW